MATRYGARVFTVRFTAGMQRTHLDLGQPLKNASGAQSTIAKSITDAADSTVGKTTTRVLTYIDRETETREHGPVEDTTPHIRVTRTSRNQDRLNASFLYGRNGSHMLAMAADPKDDASLADKAATNEFRATLYIPQSGTQGLLVAEARGRQCPGEYFLRLLSVTSRELQEKRPDADKYPWVKMDVKALVDDEERQAYLRAGRAIGVRLTKHVTRNDGERRQRKINVDQNWLPASKAGAVAAIVRGWADVPLADDGDYSTYTSKSPEKAIESILEVPVNPDDFDEAGVAWEGPDKSTTMIHPDDFKDVFTYPIGDLGRRPTDRQFQETADTLAKRMGTRLGIGLSL